MKRLVFFLIFYSTGIFLAGLKAQNFYAVDTIQKIEITFTQPNWDYILDTAKQGADTYTLAQQVKINGVVFDSVGVKYKGNSSYNPNNAKNPFHIELDHFKNQNYLGLKDIKLSNGYHEPSFVREIILYTMYQQYGEASRANYAQVYINGQYWGVYTNVEAVTKTFLNDRFYTNDNTFVFADNGGCDLRYKGNDSTKYYTPYTMKSDYGWTRLMHLCDTLNNHIPDVENVLDVDRTLWYLSFVNATVTLDSYLGNSKHNYYIYEDHNGRFNPIIWDLNGGFGVFNKPDFGVSFTVPQMQNMTMFLHGNDTMWPLVKKILDEPMYRRMYVAHMKTIVKENFANNSYYTFAQSLQAIIDTAVQSDTKKFNTYADFIANLNSNVIDGPKTIPGISLLMNARLNYLSSTPEFQTAAPVISNIASSDTFPIINTPVYITAQVTNAGIVYLGTRNTIMDRFVRQVMYDDGLHGDGSAGDNIYGVQVTVTAPELQYYIYAENLNAGMFSPERAEHEYYTLHSNYSLLQAGDVVINEILAINNSTIVNGGGVFSDWIELFNPTSTAKDLAYLNLSDNMNNPVKWQFPAGTTIAPGGYLIVWADNASWPNELHCGFGFSGLGEQAYLGYGSTTIIDSVSFPAQSTDISWGRYPNGTGPYMFMVPTFNAVNTVASVSDILDSQTIDVFPNPSKGPLFIHSTVNAEMKIYNTLGGEVLNRNISSGLNRFDPGLEAGVYFIKFEKDQKITVRKLLIVH